MKFIIVGLGNFGSTLGLRLVEDGHEVIGIDMNESLVNQLQDKLTHTVVLDTTNELGVNSLPLTDTDIIVISIGEDVGASVTTTALFKKACTTTRIISRAISDVHQNILEAMGIEEIIHPEAEFADQLANRLIIQGTVKSISLDSNYEIAEVELPEIFIGKTVAEANFVKEWGISLVTILKKRYRRNFLGRKVPYNEVSGVVFGNTVLEQGDLLVVFGKKKSLANMMKNFTKPSES